MGDTDEEKVWVLQSRSGDTAAFELLIRAHQRMVHSLTFRMTGSLADAEDLAQETFIRAYRQLDSCKIRPKSQRCPGSGGKAGDGNGARLSTEKENLGCGST